MAIAAGNQIASAVTLLPLGLLFWPQRMPGEVA